VGADGRVVLAFMTEATTVTASTPRMTSSDVEIATSGNRSFCRCPQCSSSFTPMNARISERPVER
jgi:hypothetical protein